MRPLGGAPPARAESIAAPTPSAPDRLGVVVALDEGGASPRAPGWGYRMTIVGHPGWSAEVTLGAGLLEEPAPVSSDVPPHAVRPEVDYTARDYAALRTLLLEAIGERAGPELIGGVVDQSTALVEELAYLGDALSYYQDAVATESYLTTARRRISATRHATLLDYSVQEGRSARTWVRVLPDGAVTESFTLPARTKLLGPVDGLPARVEGRDLEVAMTAAPLVFETVAEEVIAPARELPALRLDPHVHPEGRLHPGATSAAVLAVDPAPVPGTLAVLATAADADGIGPVVRLETVNARPGGGLTLAWALEDAPDADTLPPGELLFLPGNIIAADHGDTRRWHQLPAPSGAGYWPSLPDAGVTFSVGAVDASAYASAAEALDAADAVPMPAVIVAEVDWPLWHLWTVRTSLLESGPLALDFVVEVDNGGRARLRFGNNANGMAPAVDADLRVLTRIGCGSAGNVAAGTLRHIATDDTRVARIVQPARARGGLDPEPLSSIRQHAPESYRVNQRAVAAADYADLACSLFSDEIADATAEVSHDGAMPVAVVHVHTGDWTPVEPGLLARVQAALRARQPLGGDAIVRAAVPAPIVVELEVVPEPGWAVTYVGAQLDDAIRRELLGPDRFAFATSLNRSEVVALVASVPGVADAVVTRFAFVDDAPGRPTRETLVPRRGFVLRIDNDRDAPEHGSVTYRLAGVR